MTSSPTSPSGTSSPTISGPSDPQWFDANFCQVYPNSCLLWGVPWQYLAISAALFVAAALMRFIMYPVFVIAGKILTRYKKQQWRTIIYQVMFGWTVALARWGLVWAGYSTLQLPSNWTAVLNYIFPIPFIICLFLWVNAAGDAIALIGKQEFESSAQGGNTTKAVGFAEIVRVAKYLAFIIVLFIAVVIFGGNVVGFLNDAKLLGLIVVFALQPWLKNLVGGMTIFYDEKYVLKDEIRFAGVQGVVTNITLRTTRIVRSDNSIAIIPNSRLLEQPVANLSQRDLNVIVLRTLIDHTTPVDTVRMLLTQVEKALESLHPSIVAHISWEGVGIGGFGEMGAGNGRRFGVSVEGDYEMVVRTYSKKAIENSVETANLANKKLISEVILAISELMKQYGVKRRAKKSGVSATTNGGSDIPPNASLDLTNDADIELTTALMAFYI